MRPIRLRSFAALLGLAAVGVWPGAAVGQVQLRCEGTLLEARGSAEQERPTRRLSFSLSLEAEAPTADGALQSLQERLAAVRRALQGQQVEQLRVTSPSTWQRPAERNRPAAVTASLQVSGRLLPQRLQALIREVGALPGVRLAPVGTEADRGLDGVVRRQLLRGAYQDALAQAREVAAAVGLSQLHPLEVQLDGNEMRPMLMRAAAADAAPPFDPAELALPKDRLSLTVRFCAR
ncbi:MULTISPECIES: SIMPL domain-containing protein [unclassified Cyanobium]|uniref:SIMPL domain-containing protein n=1 Tax=unclassified Cyanobium TaxID=2627006 RepID=UPI0020CFA5FA|nr:MULTISPECIES: SIMPL domain-containing protein [unclassified Cyanobium]MCP9833992.1 SIMPL domain-containing protein [Cyanobium sp. La Preciosa 7G6]MCP9936755.1 SIMPL domain-containing protein [Cyanobium sp. Aljojuca 7A6]